MNILVKQAPTSKTIQEFHTDQGVQIFLLPLEAFSDFWMNSYLIIIDDYQVLVDTGSGYGDCNNHLIQRLKDVQGRIDQKVDLSTINYILLTHGHIDHYGGLPFIQERSRALIGIHELDLRTLTNPDEKLQLVIQDLNRFLRESGVPEERRSELVQMYELTKLNFTPVVVNFTYESIGMELGPFQFFHVPGHCAGQTMIRIHDVLISGDHILKEISPHQNPESLMSYTGLRHYLKSLRNTASWAEGINLTLPGHDGPISDVLQRIREIEDIHQSRFLYIENILKKPMTVCEISLELFPDVNGFNKLLALEETAAHVEYLYQQGLLSINNLDSFLQNNKEPIRYCLNPMHPGTELISWQNSK